MATQTFPDTQPDYSRSFNIENRNFLSPIGFKVTIERIKGVDYFCQTASVPTLTIQPVKQTTSVNHIPQPGDELYYEDFNMRFLIDENMKNWYQVHDWMREIATPVSAKEFGFARGKIESKNRIRRRVESPPGLINNQWRSEVSLFILSSNYRPVAEFVYHDAFPIRLTTLQFDSTVQTINYFTAECTLAYSYFDYYIYDAAQATDESMKTNYRTTSQGINIDTVLSE